MCNLNRPASEVCFGCKTQCSSQASVNICLRKRAVLTISGKSFTMLAQSGNSVVTPASLYFTRRLGNLSFPSCVRKNMYFITTKTNRKLNFNSFLLRLCSSDRIQASISILSNLFQNENAPSTGHKRPLNVFMLKKTTVR